MPGALDGITVLDFTERVQGPHATQFLGDLGADVIKVERPTSSTPDGRPDERYGAAEATLYRATFLANNRNKRSMVLDLKSPEDAATARDLVAHSDVVYENFRPGVMDRLGLGYADCRAVNPSIVYVSATGYGPDGPYRDKPGQDVLAQALSGMGAMNKAADGRPTPVGMSITDILGGLNGAAATLAALLHRERTGEGQQVGVNLLGAAIAALSEHAVHFLNGADAEPERGTVMHGHGYIAPPYGFYATKDGHVALSSGRQIPELCELLGIDDLSRDPRFDTFAKRDENRAEMEAILEDALQRRTTRDWLNVLEPADIFVAPVHSFADAFADPQVVHSAQVVDVESPDGKLQLVGPAVSFSKTPAQVRTAPPEHGAHTAEVLARLRQTTPPPPADHRRETNARDS